MGSLRRAAVAVAIAAVVAGLVRLRGSGGVPPQRGGWREVSSTELGAAEGLPSPAGSATAGR